MNMLKSTLMEIHMDTLILIMEVIMIMATLMVSRMYDKDKIIYSVCSYSFAYIVSL